MSNKFTQRNSEYFTSLISTFASILRNKQFDQMNKPELNAIVNMLCNFSYFKEIRDFLTDKQLLKVASKLRFSFIKSNTYLLREGDIVNDFIIILDGHVDVFHKNTLVAQKKYNDSIGEENIINKELNKFNFLAKTDTQILKMSKSEFLALLLTVDSEKKSKFSHFLKEFEVFRGINIKLLCKFYKFVEVKHFHYNEVIYEEGDKVDGIYFIQKGEFLIKKNKMPDKVIMNLKSIEEEIKILKCEGGFIMDGLKGKLNPKSTKYQTIQNFFDHVTTEKITENANKLKNYQKKCYDVYIHFKFFRF